MNKTLLILELQIADLEQLPTNGRVPWGDIALLVGKPLDKWLSLSRRSYAPPTYVQACADGDAYFYDVKEVRKYLDNPKAYRAKAIAYDKLRYGYYGVIHDGYLPNTKSRKTMRLYIFKNNPNRAAQCFNQGYVIRNPHAVKASKPAKAKQPTSFNR